MNYEQKYKEALERASHIKDHNTIGTPQEIAELIFPELRESEDERIRKEILEDIRNVKAVSSEEYRKKADRWIAWLEKQKKQEPYPFGDTLCDKIPDKCWAEIVKLSTNDTSSNTSELKADNMDNIDACMLRYLQSAANRKEDDEVIEDTRKFKKQLIELIQKPAEWQKKQDEEIKVYLKIPITTRYSGDLELFDKSKTHIVEGKEFCEKDIYGDSVCCWYVSTVFNAVEDKQWLIEEISECGCIPTIEERKKNLFI